MLTTARLAHEPSITATALMTLMSAGIIDDIYGADFVDGSTDGNVQDQNGHGTFVAGVVGAVGNNDLGVTGVNQVCMPPKKN